MLLVELTLPGWLHRCESFANYNIMGLVPAGFAHEPCQNSLNKGNVEGFMGSLSKGYHAVYKELIRVSHTWTSGLFTPGSIKATHA